MMDQSCVRPGLDKKERFGMDTGVIHGDSLSLIPFNLLLDFVLWNLRYVDCGVELVGGKRLIDLDYSDTVVCQNHRRNETDCRACRGGGKQSGTEDQHQEDRDYKDSHF